jgi:anti-sigma factor ChrR (cupin superfamily)
MRINADFTKRVVVRPEEYDWVASPSAGVERMMLDRIGDEVARATTIVRFAPGSYFDAHRHDGGEEYLVLDGTFSDESGDYPVGSYVRNPIGTSHKPHTDEGCTILVKLHQFKADDSAHFSVNTCGKSFEPTAVDGLQILELHRHGQEFVRMLKFAPGTVATPHEHDAGEEIYVLEGSFEDEHGHYPAGTWLRNPHGSSHAPKSEEGCLLWMKTGHLPSGEV